MFEPTRHLYYRTMNVCQLKTKLIGFQDRQFTSDIALGRTLLTLVTTLNIRVACQSHASHFWNDH